MSPVRTSALAREAEQSFPGLCLRSWPRVGCPTSRAFGLLRTTSGRSSTIAVTKDVFHDLMAEQMVDERNIIEWGPLFRVFFSAPDSGKSIVPNHPAASRDRYGEKSETDHENNPENRLPGPPGRNRRQRLGANEYGRTSPEDNRSEWGRSENIRPTGFRSQPISKYPHHD